MNDGHDASPGPEADGGVAANDADDPASDADAASPDEVDDAGASAVAPDDAFAALADETRLRTVRTLASADRPLGFTELFERVADDPDGPSAGFAYHLRQLTDRYVRTDDDGRYRPTFAGRQAARALDAGVYTERVDRDPEPVAGDCPVCGASALEARIADNHVAVACTDCATELLALPFPPGGVRDRDTDEVLPAFDAYHRARLRQLADGVCPDCAGRAEGKIAFVEPAELPDAAEAGDGTEDAPARPVVAGACADCDFRVRVPVSVALAEHPAVVAFCDDHGIDVRERPIWNLGSEWAEGVLSTDPPAVRVSVAGDGETLRLLVGDGPTVVETERVTAADDDRGGTGPTERSTEGGPEGDDADDQAATAAGSS
ncbi:DUF7351 domain-containing protein [Halobaculum roseum]|uniref:Winged helix-turn-helix domain-containing protein n=1 Tax=Halobaculum roseum TaxID=2175149 RepID=A0ABD5MM42_9EURY|nr:winged helix-turn-helix domain-containing protein [Halobaculum roseum]QZY03077.1 helix-turn-helix domain-containing protein [Halobaculum roseum]